VKIFIISDIHSNYDALASFSEFIKPMHKTGDVMACLGDIVGYGPNPSECISFVRKECDYVISGNHERMLLDKGLREFANDRAQRAIEWTDRKLSAGEKSYLAGLPEMLDIESRIVLAHGSPVEPDTYILRRAQVFSAISTLRIMKRYICFFGHTHIPGLFDEESSYYYRENERIIIKPEHYYLINPGSIGQPRDRDSRGSFCLLDDEMCITFFRFTYEIDRVYEKIKNEGIPSELGERLYYGM